MRLAAQPITVVEQTETIVHQSEEVKEEKVVEESSSSEEVEYYKESVEGICDYHYCNNKTFMRCDYDMNDIIDPRSSKC